MLNMADRQAIENLVRSADEAATRRDDAGYANPGLERDRTGLEPRLTHLRICAIVGIEVRV
jgi:hypothetical protein